MTELSAADRALLRPYVTSVDEPVYALTNLPEEVVAVLFAYYSRSREPLRENLLRLIREGDLDVGGLPALDPGDDAGRLAGARDKARAFHEKWVVGYGHSSVAEHAVVHVAVEELSILASKVVEDARLVSFTEKSTRYVPFDTRRFHTPAVFAEGAAGAVYRGGITALMETYDRLMEPLAAWFIAQLPPKAGQTEKGHAAACRAQACDVLRYLLPAATRTNLGMTINGRALEGLLVKMLSHPLEEVRRTADRIKEQSLHVIPTLIKYAARSEYRAMTEAALRPPAARILAAADQERAGAAAGDDPEGGPTVRLQRWEPDAETRIAEALLAGACDREGPAVRSAVAGLDEAGRRGLIAAALEGRGKHDSPPRALEAVAYTFEVVVDYGAWRDIQRHRMMLPREQRLGCALGYERPPALAAAGMAPEFDRAMAAASAAWEQLAGEHPEEAAYVVPLAFRKRVFLTMNLRELHHFIPLRSSRQGHASYRRVAQAMHRELERVHPFLASFIPVDRADYELSRA